MPTITQLAWLAITTATAIAVWQYQRWSNARKARELQAAVDRESERADREKERREAIAAGHQAVLDRLAVLEKNENAAASTLALLQQEMLPMAEAMKRKLVELLTHPSDEFKTPDVLLAEVKKVGAPMPADLKPFLKERIQSDSPHVTEQEKLAAEALPIITRMAELEAREPHLEITGVQLVSNTAKTPETKLGEES